MVEQQPGGWEQQTVDFEPGSQGARIPTKNWKVLVTEVLFTYLGWADLAMHILAHPCITIHNSPVCKRASGINISPPPSTHAQLAHLNLHRAHRRDQMAALVVF